MLSRIRRQLFPLVFASACVTPFSLQAAGTSHPLEGAQQLIVVTTADWNTPRGQLQGYGRDAQGRWQPSGPAFEVAIGRHGSAWGEGLQPKQPNGPQKREGDGRSPAGVYALGEAFGYAAAIDSAMPYRQMQADSWCMDMPDSPLYNRIVDASQVGDQAVKGSSEPMRLDLHHDGDPRYREGLVIAHNAQAIPGRGSCIFAHLWRAPGEATAGCTAMAPASMAALMAWLQPTQQPRFLLLPKREYQRLQASWQLPIVEGAR
ncbi:MAG TPA: L,D-transpeptidase family protein [Stenotrophomonas sp.]|jgi:L,D-peptidoglycan transpeptidase YkuD (ErfK/YbiS/YcfS/YnhG family)